MDQIKAWQKYFSEEFDDIYVSAFKPNGISRDAALIAVRLNAIDISLDNVTEAIEELKQE